MDLIKGSYVTHNKRQSSGVVATSPVANGFVYVCWINSWDGDTAQSHREYVHVSELEMIVSDHIHPGLQYLRYGIMR